MSVGAGASSDVDVGGGVNITAACLRLRREESDERSDRVLPRLRVDGSERRADKDDDDDDGDGIGGGCDVGAFGISRSGFKSCATCFTLADKLNRISGQSIHTQE